MADFLKILESKIDFSPTEASVAERWFRQVERDNRYTNQISSGGGGGYVTSLEAGNVAIDLTEGITLRNPGTGDRSVRLDPDGDAWFGHNIDDPDFTTMFIISNQNNYNGETFGAGDLLIGSNSTGKGNMWWDASVGKLYFRSGTTQSVEIGDGGIIASWGQIGGWSIDATRIYKSEIELDSSADEIRVGTNKVILGTAGITAIQGTIAGWTINASQITKGVIDIDSANEKIAIDTNKVVLNSSGITAIAGTIGGWTINASTIAKTGIILDSDNDQIRVGASAPTIVLDGGTKQVRSSNYSADASGFVLGRTYRTDSPSMSIALKVLLSATSAK